jgi:hypothetical protein
MNAKTPRHAGGTKRCLDLNQLTQPQIRNGSASKYAASGMIPIEYFSVDQRDTLPPPLAAVEAKSK